MASDGAPKMNPVVIGLMISSAVGLIGFIVVVIVKNTTTLLPLGPALALDAGFGALMLISAFSTGFVPEGPRNAYVPAAGGHAPRSFPEFRAREAGFARVRRIVILSTMWTAFSLWLLFWTAAFSLLIRWLLVSPDADVDSGPILTPFTVGIVALAVYTVLRIFMAPLTSQGAHMRALHDALPGAVIRPNRTSSSVARMAKNTSPGVRLASTDCAG